MRARGTGQSFLLLLDVIDILDKLAIPYAIIGAFAASFHGVVRASMDADAMISLPSGEADGKVLMAKLRRAGLKGTYRKGDVSDPVGAVINVEDKFGNRVDLLMNIRRVPEASFSRTVEARFQNRKIRLIGVEDFIAMKIFAGSPKDLSDVTGVLKISRRRINRVLLRELVRSYGRGASQTLESLLKESARRVV